MQFRFGFFVFLFKVSGVSRLRFKFELVSWVLFAESLLLFELFKAAKRSNTVERSLGCALVCGVCSFCCCFSADVVELDFFNGGRLSL